METSAKVKLGVSLAVATGLAFMTLNSQLNANSQACTTTKLPDECTWLDEDSFRVFSALADTFFPQYQESEITLDSIRDALDAVNPGIFDASGGSIDIIHKHREMLCRGAITANVDSVAAMALQMNASPADQTQLYGLFKALSTSVGCGLLTGNFVPFQYLSLPSREVAVRKLRDSIIPELRAAFQAVKRLCGSIYLGFRENGKDNMAWDHLGYTPQHTLNPPDNYYQIPEAPITKNLSDYKLKPNAIGVHPKVPPPAVVSRLLNEAVASNTNTAAANETITLDADVVVVGSGAGGGMLAAELAKAGYNVIVLEKAGYYTPQDDFCRWRELEAFGKTFEKGGLCTTKDGHITILAGACVGGGTTINWSASFRTPDSIVKEWDDSCGGGSCFRYVLIFYVPSMYLLIYTNNLNLIDRVVNLKQLWMLHTISCMSTHNSHIARKIVKVLIVLLDSPAASVVRVLMLLQVVVKQTLIIDLRSMITTVCYLMVGNLLVSIHNQSLEM